MFIVELEQGVWLANGEGDPPRTLKEENAERFGSMLEAATALTEARTFRPFKNATINGG